MEGRIIHLARILENAHIVEGTEADVVAAGSIVTIRYADDDEVERYLVGSIEERHETLDVVSSSSPLGQALLGHGPGEIVSYEGPRRTFQVEIVSVRAGV